MDIGENIGKMLNEKRDLRKATFFQKCRLHSEGWEGDYDNVTREDVKDIIEIIKQYGSWENFKNVK